MLCLRRFVLCLVLPASLAMFAEDKGARLEKYQNVQHPRLLVTDAKLAVIREKIKIPDSHWQQAYSLMLKQNQDETLKTWDGGEMRKSYTPVYASRDLAFLSLLETDPAKKRRYAVLASQVLPDLNYIQNVGFKSKSLGHAMATFGIALTYDWAYEQWTDAERKKAEDLLEYFKKHWETNRRLKEDQVTGYNFYGVLYGAETMLLLASGAEKTSPRFPICVDVLTKHLADMGGELGAHNEGIGYTEYPMGFSLPAAFALAQHGFPGPIEAAKKHDSWHLLMNVATFHTSYARKYLPYGVTGCGRGGGNEGFASLVLGFCPPEKLPYYLWTYDRHEGFLSKAEPGLRFESGRGNTFMALLFYPTDVVAKDPTGVMPKMISDRDGYIFSRNRFQDENDIQVGLLNPVRRSGGWSQDEFLNLRLLAYNTAYIGGTGKERGVEDYSMILVDGQNTNKTVASAGFQAGKLLAVEPNPSGGTALVDASAYYANLGLTQAQRQLLVMYSDPKENTAILSTLDDLKSEKSHQYTWQINVGGEGLATADEDGEGEEGGKDKATTKPPTPVKGGAKPIKGKIPPKTSATDPEASLEGTVTSTTEPKKDEAAPPPAKRFDDGVKMEQGTEGGHPCFTLTGRKGYVKGWVVEPADATLTVGDPLRVETKGTDKKIWVVLYLGSGKPIAAEFSGTGLDSVVTLAGKQVTYDAGKNRILAK